MAIHLLTAAIAVQSVQWAILSAIPWVLTSLSSSLHLIMVRTRPTAQKKTRIK